MSSTSAALIRKQAYSALRSDLSRSRRHPLWGREDASAEVSSGDSPSGEFVSRRLKFVKAKKAENRTPYGRRPSSSSSDPSSPRSSGRGHHPSEFEAPSRHLFSEDSVQRLLVWPRSKQSVGGGLRNLGNSCFMNATLQCLCYTPAFQNYIGARHHTAKCRIGGFCLFCEMHKLMPEMLNSRSATTPTKVFGNLRTISRELRPGRQEDAHEFLRHLMDAMQTSALKQERAKVKDTRIQETTAVHKIWGGYLRSQVKCCKCGGESNSYEAILDLSLEIRGNSVDSALRHFMKREKLDGENKYRCDACRRLCKAVKQFSIFEAPNVLALHLKRFEYGASGSPRFGRRRKGRGGYRMFGGGKINKHVEFTESLDITQFMSYPTCPKVTYKLFGVLIHYGHSAQSGHYVSYIRSPSGDWQYMDDSSVTRASVSRVVTQSAYILFYTRNEPKVAYKSPRMSPRMPVSSSLLDGSTFADKLKLDSTPKSTKSKKKDLLRTKKAEAIDSYAVRSLLSGMGSLTVTETDTEKRRFCVPIASKSVAKKARLRRESGDGRGIDESSDHASADSSSKSGDFEQRKLSTLKRRLKRRSHNISDSSEGATVTSERLKHAGKSQLQQSGTPSRISSRVGTDSAERKRSFGELNESNSPRDFSPDEPHLKRCRRIPIGEHLDDDAAAVFSFLELEPGEAKPRYAYDLSKRKPLVLRIKHAQSTATVGELSSYLPTADLRASTSATSSALSSSPCGGVLEDGSDSPTTVESDSSMRRPLSQTRSISAIIDSKTRNPQALSEFFAADSGSHLIGGWNAGGPLPRAESTSTWKSEPFPFGKKEEWNRQLDEGEAYVTVRKRGKSHIRRWKEMDVEMEVDSETGHKVNHFQRRQTVGKGSVGRGRGGVGRRTREESAAYMSKKYGKRYTRKKGEPRQNMYRYHKRVDLK